MEDILATSSSDDEDKTPHFFEHPTECLGCDQDQNLWDMYGVIKDFFDDNYLPTANLDFSTYVQWVNNGDSPLSLTTLHNRLRRKFDLYDKTESQLTYFVFWSALSSSRTTPRWRSQPQSL
jgi:hypothetical protein